MRFEWDENKRAANLGKQEIDLVTGADLFDGRAVITYPSPRASEQRFVTVGLLQEELVAVVWTERKAAVRLISLRSRRCRKKNVS
jgi:uncharacterized protein